MRDSRSRDDDLRSAHAEAADPVWRLLARAPLAPPDPWFAARTVARCRYAGLAPEPRFWMLKGIWRWVLGSGLGVCLAVVAVTRVHHVEATDNQKNVQEAFEIVASMGDDTEGASSSAAPVTWQDSSY